MWHGDVIHQLVSVSLVACHLESDVDRLGKNGIALSFEVALERRLVDRDTRDERYPVRFAQQRVELIDQIDHDRREIPSDCAADQVTLVLADHRRQNLAEFDLVLDPCPLEVLEINRVPLVSHGRRSDLSFLEGFAEFANLRPHQVPAVPTELAEGGGKLDAGEQVVSEGFGRQNLRADRRGFETKLFEHTLLESPVTAASRDAETHLSVVDADSAGDFSHQLF